MQLSRDFNSAKFIISEFNHKTNIIKVNDAEYHESIIISPQKLITTWQPKNLTQLTTKHIQELLSLNPSVVLLGVGSKLVFPNISILKPLIDANIGYEIMNTSSVCRTYTILASENRNVVAGIII